MRFRKNTLVWAVILSMAGSVLLPASCVNAYAAQNMTEPANNLNTESDIYLASSPVVMDVTYGYDGAAKSGRYVPVQISLANQEQKAFEGTLRIQAMESDYEIYDYDYPLTLSAGEKLEKNLDIPAGRGEILYVKLFDGNGTELVRKRLRINVSREVAELYVGILSDSPDSLNYLNGVGVNYSSVRTKTFNLTADTMPDKAVGMDLLDVLLITDYDTRKLSDSQTDAVWEWVRGGGTLLIGTGGRANDTLAAFREEIVETAFPAPDVRSVDMGVEYATNGPGDSFINLTCADISLKGGTEVLANDEFPVLTSTPKGKGLVGVAAYDFVDISDFCETQRSYVDKLLTALLGEDKLNNLSSYLYYGNSSKYWSVQSILNTGNVDKLPNMPLYVIVILGYIILVGPGLYLLLKKQERRRFYRTGAVVLSLIFAAVIYLMGVGTRFKNTFFTYATILDTSEKSIDEYTYINIRTPYNKPYAVSLDPGYDLLPITRSYYYDMTPVPKFTGTEESRVRVEYGLNETKISAQNVVSFTPKYFSLVKKSPNTEHQGLTGNVTLFDGQISGTVTNRYSFPVEKVGVMMFGQMIVIDELGPGETMSLDGLKVINYPLNSSYLIAERVTGGYQYEKPDIEDENYMLALSRANILGFYLDTYASVYSPEARIVAFSREQSDSKFLAKGDYDTYGMTMFTSALDISTKKNGYTYRSALMKAPHVVSGQYYAASNSVYGMDPTVLEYSLGNDIEVESLTFEKISDEFLEGEKNNGLSMFSGSLYFYNHDTGIYDLMDTGKSVYAADELEPYLSPGNTMTIKYIFDNNTDYSWVTLPMLTVLGKDK